MKLIIDIDDKDKKICEQYINGKLGDELGDYVNITELANAIANGIPYEPKGDLISREDLKKAINEEALNLSNGGRIFIENINKIIDNAPTVEERPIRCKDCKHTVLSKDGKTLICCLTMRVGTVRPNFYCGNGEMKGGAE